MTPTQAALILQRHTLLDMVHERLALAADDDGTSIQDEQENRNDT